MQERTNRHISVWNPSSLVIRAFGVHCHFRASQSFLPLVHTCQSSGASRDSKAIALWRLTQVNDGSDAICWIAQRRWLTPFGGIMKLLKSMFLVSAVTFGVCLAGGTNVSAGTISSPTASVLVPQAMEPSTVEQVRHRRYRRHRHGRRYRGRRRGYRHYHGGYWYAYPWWTVPLYTEPRRYGRCDYWHRRCRANWGRGADYRGCMRYHDCL